MFNERSCYLIKGKEVLAIVVNVECRYFDYRFRREPRV